MAITGAVAAAIRRDNPYGDLIALGARFIADPGGFRTGGRPYYWLRGRAYRRFKDMPGAVVQRASAAIDADAQGLLRLTPANEPREVPFRGMMIEESRTRISTSANLNPAGLGSVTAANGAVVEVVPVGSLPAPALAAFQASPLRGLVNSVYKVTLDGSQPYQGVFLSTALPADTAGCWSVYAHIESGVANIGLSGSTGMLGSVGLSAGFQRVVRDNSQSNAARVLRLGHASDSTSTPGVFYFALDMFETGVFSTTPVPATVSGVQSVRAADIAYLGGIGDLLAGDLTLVGHQVTNAYDLATQRFVALSDGASANRFTLERSSGATARCDAGSQGVVAGTSSARPGSQLLRGAARLGADGAVKAAWNGALTAGAVITPILGMNRLDIGALSNSQLSMSNAMHTLVALLGPVDDAQLARLTQ